MSRSGAREEKADGWKSEQCVSVNDDGRDRDMIGGNWHGPGSGSGKHDVTGNHTQVRPPLGKHDPVPAS